MIQVMASTIDERQPKPKGLIFISILLLEIEFMAAIHEPTWYPESRSMQRSSGPLISGPHFIAANYT